MSAVPYGLRPGLDRLSTASRKNSIRVESYLSVEEIDRHGPTNGLWCPKQNVQYVSVLAKECARYQVQFLRPSGGDIRTIPFHFL